MYASRSCHRGKILLEALQIARGAFVASALPNTNQRTMLDLNDVALFVHVVRCGSFAEASRQLGMPSNTLSRRVQQLEERLGTRLLQRSTRSLALTSAGVAFHARCASAVDGIVTAGDEVMSGLREPSGLIRVAAPADFFDYFMIEWLAEFLAARPRVRVDFVLTDTRVDLITDRIDVAIWGGPVEESGSLVRTVLDTDTDVLVASPGYIAQRGAPSTLDALADHDCVTFSHPSGRNSWRLTSTDGHDEEVHVAGRFTADSAKALLRAALAGLGVALLPAAMTRRDLRSGALVRVLTTHHRTGFGAHLVYPSARQLPLAVSAFIDLVTEKLNAIDEC